MPSPAWCWGPIGAGFSTPPVSWAGSCSPPCRWAGEHCWSGWSFSSFTVSPGGGCSGERRNDPGPDIIARSGIATGPGTSIGQGTPVSLKIRIIPCLDVAGGRVVKGVRFVDLVDAGDPVEAAMAYDA